MRPILAGLFLAALAAHSVARLETWGTEERLITDAIAKSPAKIRTRCILAKYFMDRGDLDEAIGILEGAAALQAQQSFFSEPRVLAYLNLGRAQTMKGEIDRALGTYDELLRLYPMSRGFLEAVEAKYGPGVAGRIMELYSRVYDNVAFAYYKAGEAGKEMEAYRMSLRFNPRNDTAWADLGVLYFEMGRRGEALEALRRAVSLNPGNELAWRYLDKAEGRPERDRPR